ncbi:hypothetical protein Q5752_002004 [Cryptotrichosporon argae]
MGEPPGVFKFVIWRDGEKGVERVKQVRVGGHGDGFIDITSNKSIFKCTLKLVDGMDKLRDGVEWPATAKLYMPWEAGVGGLDLTWRFRHKGWETSSSAIADSA